jgi:hypothetical protein
MENAMQQTLVARGTPPAAAETAPESFEAFWSEYPRKVGKPAARRAWKKVNGHSSAVMPGLCRWKAYWDRRNEPEFIPHASTWLNQERWGDEPEPAPIDVIDAAMAMLAEKRAKEAAR